MKVDTEFLALVVEKELKKNTSINTVPKRADLTVKLLLQANNIRTIASFLQLKCMNR
jgi:hypothetical protein